MEVLHRHIVRESKGSKHAFCYSEGPCFPFWRNLIATTTGTTRQQTSNSFHISKEELKITE